MSHMALKGNVQYIVSRFETAMNVAESLESVYTSTQGRAAPTRICNNSSRTPWHRDRCR